MARVHRAGQLLLAGLALLTYLPSGGAVDADCPLLLTGSRSCVPKAPNSFLPDGFAAAAKKASGPDLDVLAELLEGVGVMQDQFFQPWLGTWPTSIDWTGAVMGTHVAGALHSISDVLMLMDSGASGVEDWRLKENLLDTYFAQIVSYHFGQNALEIRGEAFDDILWVVLGWLEAVEFVNAHTGLYYVRQTLDSAPDPDISTILQGQTWYGNQWIPSFAHRARIFWDLATTGWDTTLCGGGMNWNPRLLPYKNAITNELYISGSIAMYLYFPGDNNTSPFFSSQAGSGASISSEATRDPKYLNAAVDGYTWLVASNMTDAQGLYTDGYHISGYGTPGNNNTSCDERNEMVFTYNQGVVLTGVRGLWEATGVASYLSDGHKLIQNVINATGYNLKKDRPFEDLSSYLTQPGSGSDKKRTQSQLPTWYGLGRLGVIEDQCDASGTCSQDVQTFKGIFFHHLTYFCRPLDEVPDAAGDATAVATKKSHEAACASYGGWLGWNAQAALATRDATNHTFGGWWTAGLLRPVANQGAGAALWDGDWPTLADDGINRAAAPNAVDYRSYGVPHDAVWRAPADVDADIDGEQGHGELWHQGPDGPADAVLVPGDESHGRADRAELRRRGLDVAAFGGQKTTVDDPNTRGRGRTVETQGSGLALIRAYWQIAQVPLAAAAAV